MKREACAPGRPPGFPRFTDKEAVADHLLDRGYCCEREKMDLGDVRHVLGWAPAGTRFKLIRVRPGRFTPCVLPAKRFKRWPIVLGFCDGPLDESSGLSIVDGLHRCAVARHRGYPYIWAYAPCRADGRLFSAEEWEAFERRDLSLSLARTG